MKQRKSLKKWFDKSKLEAGCDEAGRGSLSGPVVAAAVILPKHFIHRDLRDSKQVSMINRYKLRTIIQQKAIAWSVAYVSQNEIDEKNILNASFIAMHRAIRKLNTTPELLLIDGNRFTPFPDIDHHCIIQGDDKYFSIAAASILAKTYRDDYMSRIHDKYPVYNWGQNKGYGTLEHRTAVIKQGLSPYHRRTFCTKILNNSNKPN